jgi:hypothetical protein
MRRLACLAVLLALSGCGAQPTATPPPPTPPPTATVRPTATPAPTRTPAPTPTAIPTVPPFAPPIPTLAPATQRYAEEVGLALGRLGEYVAAIGQGCATLDPAACRRAYDANRPLYEREAARVAALTAPPACAAARDRLNAALAATGRLFDGVDAGLRRGADPLTLLGTVAGDSAAAGQALQDLGAELANGTCR